MGRAGPVLLLETARCSTCVHFRLRRIHPMQNLAFFFFKEATRLSIEVGSARNPKRSRTPKYAKSTRSRIPIAFHHDHDHVVVARSPSYCSHLRCPASKQSPTFQCRGSPCMASVATRSAAGSWSRSPLPACVAPILKTRLPLGLRDAERREAPAP